MSTKSQEIQSRGLRAREGYKKPLSSVSSLGKSAGENESQGVLYHLLKVKWHLSAVPTVESLVPYCQMTAFSTAISQEWASNRAQRDS